MGVIRHDATSWLARHAGRWMPMGPYRTGRSTVHVEPRIPASREVDELVEPGWKAPVQAGVLAGMAGLAAFLLIHHVLIVPIWFITPVGAVVAAVGGAAVGTAYADLLPHLPGRPWTAVAIVLVIGAILLPAFAVAELRGPMFAMDADGGGTLLVPREEAAVRVVLGLLGTAVVAGAVLGWLLTRSRRAAATLAAAGLVLALGPGHNIPMLGGTPAVGKELVILATVVGVSSIVLVEGSARLVRRGRAVDDF
jgi:hypothetical protein